MSGAAPPRSPPKARWLPLQCLASLALLAVLPGAVASLPYRLGLVAAAAPALDQAAWGMVGLSIAGFATVAFARWSLPPVSWRPVRALAVLGVYLPAASIWLLGTIGYLYAMHALGHPVAPQRGLQDIVAIGPRDLRIVPFAIAIVVAAPLAEEIVFRGYLLSALQLVLARWPAQICTAAAFGLVHGLDYALPMALLGLVFGWLRQRHGCLWPSMLAHMLHNGITMAIALCAPSVFDWLYPR